MSDKGALPVTNEQRIKTQAEDLRKKVKRFIAQYLISHIKIKFVLVGLLLGTATYSCDSERDAVLSSASDGFGCKNADTQPTVTQAKGFGCTSSDAQQKASSRDSGFQCSMGDRPSSATPTVWSLPVTEYPSSLTMSGVVLDHFAFAKAALTPSHLHTLDQFASAMSPSCAASVLVEARADDQFKTRRGNQRVSDARAQIVARYLLTHGILVRKLESYAHTKPLLDLDGKPRPRDAQRSVMASCNP